MHMGPTKERGQHAIGLCEEETGEAGLGQKNVAEPDGDDQARGNSFSNFAGGWARKGMPSGDAWGFRLGAVLDGWLGAAGDGTRTSCMPGKHSTPEFIPVPGLLVQTSPGVSTG